jgi:hypothetical protein
MLNQLVNKGFGFVFRVVLVLAGLVFMASLLAAALLVLVVWLLRAAWARLTGRPVSPWTFQVNRQAMWNRFYRAPGAGGARQHDESDVIDAEVKEVTDVKEIRDVREIKPPQE